MRGRNQATLVVILGTALNGVTCAFPADNSPEVYVTIETPALVLLDGDEMTIRARAWRVIGTPDTGNGDDEPLANVDFQWTSSSNTVARVDNDGAGYATVLGVGPGLSDITARVISFEKAGSAALPLRVSGFLEIDSMTPPTVKWGDKLTLWGVGIQYAFITSLDGSGLIPDSLSYVQSNGFSRMEFWVPQPARTSQLFVLGPGVFFNTPDSVAVDTVDLYEPNTVSPTLLNLDGAGPYPTLPFVKFFNPALAFEELPRDTTQGYDWYRFTRSDTSRPLTLVVRPQGNLDSTGLFMVIADSILFNGSFHDAPPTPPNWFVTSQGYYYCARGGFSPLIPPFDSMVIALKTLPRYVPGNNGIHILNFYGKRLNYMMIAADTVIPGAKIQQDRFEENDVCTMADATGKIIPVGPLSPFGDTLTIDVPHDLDWYRFRVNAPLAGDTTTVRIAGRPSGGAVGDRSDVDLYVLDTNFVFWGAANDVGSFDILRLALPSGEYYLAVVDYSGEPTRYSLCISVRFGCIPPFAPAPPTAAARPRRTPARATAGLRPDGHRFAVPAAQIPRGRSPFHRP
ncbi:MAG TPA: hypothetical protein VJ755_02435 [Gemmatimonadales bacterium]|nr:hypothetical protein [Gemmatimonadales bacterium]